MIVWRRLLFLLLPIVLLLTGCTAPVCTQVYSAPEELNIPMEPSSLLWGETMRYTLAAAESTDSSMASDLAKWRAVNPNVCAMMSIADIELNTPVVQATESNTQWLRMDIEGNADRTGCVFVDYRCNFGECAVRLIHGHNMSDGSAFGGLPDYLEAESIDSLPMIELYTESGVSQYKPFSIFSVDSTKEALNLDFLANYDELWATAYDLRDRSWVSGGEPASIDLLLLNTCWYGKSGKEHNLHCILAASRV